MENKYYKIVGIFILLLLCNMLMAQKVLRWPNRSNEKQSRILTLDHNESIFKDFLWTTPDFQPIRLKNSNTCKTCYSHLWKNSTIIFRKADSGTIVLDLGNGETIVANREKSDGDRYYDIRKLKSKQELKHRWVAKHKVEFKTVHVQKTRQVPQTSVGANGMPTTTYRTEFYTDVETRHVPVIDRVWEPYWTSVYEIPDYFYYQFSIDSISTILLYEVVENKEYYLQNTSYYCVTEKNEGFWGTKEINLLFIDINSNGIFFENDDQILFNTWNPYKKESKFQTLPFLLDNEWYSNESLKDNMFLNFSPDNSNKALKIEYENEKYINDDRTGKLVLHNLKKNNRVIINGKRYRPKSKYKIEYGKYKLVIQEKGYLDFEKVFEINNENKIMNLNYICNQPAGILEIRNIFNKNYRIVVTCDDFKETYFNKNLINVPIGEVMIKIYTEGFVFEKKIEMKSNEGYTLDFEKEIRE